MARNFTAANSEAFEHTTIAPVTDYPLSMACWFRDTDGSTNDRCMMQIADISDSSKYFRLGLDDVSRAIRGVSLWGGFLSKTTTTTVTDDVWEHACMVTTSTDLSVFLNGAGKGTDSGSTDTPTGVDGIGIGLENDSSPDDYWEGDLAECAVWNVVLSDAEVAILALGYSPLFVRPANLVFYAPLYSKTGNAADIVGGLILTDGNTVQSAAHPRIIYPIGLYEQNVDATAHSFTQAKFRFRNDDGGLHAP